MSLLIYLCAPVFISGKCVARTLNNYAPQREATETNSDSCQLRPFPKWGILLMEIIGSRFLHCLTKYAAYKGLISNIPLHNNTSDKSYRTYGVHYTQCKCIHFVLNQFINAKFKAIFQHCRVS